MADVKIRKLPSWVIDTWKIKAEANGMSLEEQLRSLLTEQALQSQHEFARESAAIYERLYAKYGLMEDSTPGIVKERHERG